MKTCFTCKAEFPLTSSRIWYDCPSCRAKVTANRKRNKIESERVYEVEDVALAPHLERFYFFDCIEDVDDYIRSVLTLPEIKATYPNVAIESVQVSRRPGVSYKRNKTIYIDPEYGMHESGVLHELAHLLADHEKPERWPGRGRAHQTWREHGPRFQRVYVDLVSYVVGPDVGKALADSFAATITKKAA